MCLRKSFACVRFSHVVFLLCFVKCSMKTSLIPETLKEMEGNEDFQITAAQLKKLGQKQLTKEERRKRQRTLHSLQIPDFRSFLTKNSTDDGKIERGVQLIGEMKLLG